MSRNTNVRSVIKFSKIHIIYQDIKRVFILGSSIVVINVINYSLIVEILQDIKGLFTTNGKEKENGLFASFVRRFPKTQL